MKDDAGIKKVLNWIRMRSWVNEIKIYAQHNVDVPIIAKDPLLLKFPNVDANSNDGVGDETIPTQCNHINEGI